ncbi:hypothetical protein, partial [Actinomadura rubrisoli]|uniref:hypothetical protein n=1 Tax=Actinomadura rubrisoli TaxID=2530368 RepID=UPI001A9EB435
MSTSQDRLQTLTDRLKSPTNGQPVRRLPAQPDRSTLRIFLMIAVVASLAAGGYLWMARPRP